MTLDTSNWQNKFKIKRSKVIVTQNENVKIIFRAYLSVISCRHCVETASKFLILRHTSYRESCKIHARYRIKWDIENLRFSTNISLYLGNDTRLDRSIFTIMC